MLAERDVREIWSCRLSQNPHRENQAPLTGTRSRFEGRGFVKPDTLVGQA